MKKSTKQEIKKTGAKTTDKIKKGSEQVKEKTQKTAEKTEDLAKKAKKNVQRGIKKVKKEYNSPRGKKVRQWVKKTSEVVGSHLATIRAGITLSNEESRLLQNLKETLNKKGIYPSKSEILRAGLWNLQKMNAKQLEEVLKELVKVKQMRIL